MNLYKSKLISFLKELNIDVDKAPRNLFKRMDAKINEQGSNLPRTLLAYYFSFFHNNQPEDSQIILGLVNDIDISLFEKDNDSDIILLKDDKYSLLKKDFYDEVNEEIYPIIEKGIFRDELPF